MLVLFLLSRAYLLLGAALDRGKFELRFKETWGGMCLMSSNCPYNKLKLVKSKLNKSRLVNIASSIALISLLITAQPVAMASELTRSTMGDHHAPQQKIGLHHRITRYIKNLPFRPIATAQFAKLTKQVGEQASQDNADPALVELHSEMEKVVRSDRYRGAVVLSEAAITALLHFFPGVEAVPTAAVLASTAFRSAVFWAATELFTPVLLGHRSYTTGDGAGFDRADLIMAALAHHVNGTADLNLPPTLLKHAANAYEAWTYFDNAIGEWKLVPAHMIELPYNKEEAEAASFAPAAIDSNRATVLRQAASGDLSTIEAFVDPLGVSSN